MRKSYLPFVMSCLLLAAFIGSAEAKKFDEGTTVFQFSTARDSRLMNDVAGEGLKEDLPWLLISYYGIAEEDLVIDLENPPTDSPEVVPAARENEDDSAVAEEMWSGGRKIASRGYGDPLFKGATPGASGSTDGENSDGAAFSTGSNVAAERYQTNITVNYSLVDPPIVVAINPVATPRKNDKKDDSGGASEPATAAEVGSGKPGTAADPTPVEDQPETGKDQPRIKADKANKDNGKKPVVQTEIEADQPQKDNGKKPVAQTEIEADQPKKDNGKKPAAQTEIVIDPITIPATTIPAIVGEQKPVKLKKTKKSQDGAEVEIANEGIAAAPAPVPEPATVLLLTAGIAGLAMGGVRRNKHPAPDSST